MNRPQVGPQWGTRGRDQVAGEGADRNQHNAFSSRVDGPPILAAVLAYAAQGRPAFPLHSVYRRRCTCGRGDCGSPGKHPRTGNGLHDATTDVDQLTRWWGRWPGANIGIATGPTSLIFVLDVDKIDALDALQDRHEQLPETLTQRTGSGGLHLVYRYPEGVTIGNRAGLLDGLDVRGEGGYIVVPPSVHVSSRRYTWTKRMPPAPAPAWLVEVVRAKPAPPRSAVTPARYVGTDIGTRWGEAVLQGELRTLVGARDGERNDTLFRVACNVFGPVKAGQLDSEGARRALEHAALTTGLEAIEIRKTLASAWHRAEPRAPEPTARR